MPLLSCTRLHLRAWYYVPVTLLHAARSSKQAQRSDGFIAGALSADLRHLTLWTATVWTDEASMRAFQFGGAHQQTMRRIGEWCDESAVVHVERESTEIPTDQEALELMRSRGRPTRLPRPSLAHAAGDPVPDKRAPRFAQRLSPVRAR